MDLFKEPMEEENATKEKATTKKATTEKATTEKATTEKTTIDNENAFKERYGENYITSSQLPSFYVYDDDSEDEDD